MDINKTIERAKNILLTPKTEWPVIAGEATTVAGLYKNWIIWLAAIPALAGFVKSSVIGYSAFGVTARASISGGLTGAIIGYVLSLAAVYVTALIIDALAPTFGAQKDQTQALKTAAYSWTASWIANIGMIIPWVGLLLVLAGGIYSIYLLYLGLPATMKCPPEKTAGYTAVSFICALVLGWIVAIAITGITGAGMFMGGALSGGGSSATFDKNTWLGQMETASKQMEAAQKSGDADAQSKAATKLVGAALGGGDQVEALAPDMLKPFIPATLAGLNRTNFSAERNAAMGLQISTAQADYGDGNGQALHLEISDSGSMKGLMSLAGWAGVQNEKETEHGYEKIYKQDGRLIHERWDSQARNGEFSVVLGDRFMVKVSGQADSLDQFKGAVASLDLAGLEALKNQGVKKE